MVKKTKRKAFNFLRSYFDVLNELTNDKDKLDFLTAIINKQFLNEDPIKLNFIVNLCYESQRHQIETSVKGWLRATKEELGDTLLTTLPTNPMTTLPTNPMTTLPTNPKEEEEEEEEKEEIYIHPLCEWISKELKNVSTLKNKLTNEQAERLVNEFSKESLKEILEAMENKVNLSKSYSSVNLTIRNWIKTRKKDNPNFGNIIEQSTGNKEIDLLLKYKGVPIHEIPFDDRTPVALYRQLNKGYE
jgi:hypothetical protein